MFGRFGVHLKSSISSKYITAFLLCLVLPLVIGAVAFTTSLQRMLAEKEYQNMSEKINVSGRAFDSAMQEMSNIVTSVIVNEDVMNILKSTHHIPTYEWFQDFNSLENTLLSICSKGRNTFQVSLLTMDGRLYRNGSNYDGLLTLESEIVSTVLNDSDGQCLLNRRLEGIDENDIITYGKIIRQRGHVLGVMLVNMPVSELDIIFELFARDQYELCIFSDSNRLLYASGASLTGEGSSLLLAPGQTRSVIDGQPHLITLRTTKNGQNKISVSVPEHVIYWESRQLIAGLVVVLALVIVVTTLTLFILSTRISHNIKLLSHAVSEYGQGRLPEMLEIRSVDEVGQLASGFLAMRQQIDVLMQKIRDDEQTRWQLQFQALQAQINPHMIYNTLNTITYLAQLQHVKNIEDVSSSFSKLLHMVSKRKEFWISIEEELECARAYLLIKKYNLVWDIETIFDIDRDTLNCRIIKLLIQPLLENAIVHGFSENHMDGRITVTLRRVAARIYLEIADNGIGMSIQKLNDVLTGESKSTRNFVNIGVRNTIERLRLQYGDAAGFEMESHEGSGTVIKIFFPAEPVTEVQE